MVRSTWKCNDIPAAPFYIYVSVENVFTFLTLYAITVLYLVVGASGQCLKKMGLTCLAAWIQMTLRMRNLKGWGGCGSVYLPAKQISMY